MLPRTHNVTRTALLPVTVLGSSRSTLLKYPAAAGVGAKSALKVKVQDGPELYVCRLSEGRSDFANLDLVLDEYTEFTVEGAALHITGTAPARPYC